MFRIQHQYLCGGELDIVRSLLFTLVTPLRSRKDSPHWLLAFLVPLFWFPSFFGSFHVQSSSITQLYQLPISAPLCPQRCPLIA